MKAHQHINQDSGDTEWYTPPEIVEAARIAMCGIDLDPASCELANATVKATTIFTKEDDGLSKMWWGRVWMNHPFSKAENALWVDKLLSEYEDKNIDEACCITFAATSERWFRPLLAFPQCFIHGRTNYILPDGFVKKGVTKGSVVTYLGPDVFRFVTAFNAIGTCKLAIHPTT